jgi:hypothetical protein
MIQRILMLVGVISWSTVLQAQLPLKGDTVIYTKTTKTVKQLLPAAINFLTTKSTVKDVMAVFKDAKMNKLNDGKNFILLCSDKKNTSIKYILGGSTDNQLIEIVRISLPESLLPSVMQQVGAKTVTDKEVDYWFFLTQDGYKVFFMVNKMMMGSTIQIGIKPKTWVHLLKK